MAGNKTESMGRTLMRTVALVNNVEPTPTLESVEAIHGLRDLLSISRALPRLRHVLVPVDFTVRSLRSLPYASFLARQFGCAITLLHVVQLNIVGEERGVPLERFLEEEKSAAQRTLQRIASSLCLSARVVVNEGAPDNAILREVAESGIDLIIMGRYRRKSIWRLLSPSVGRKIICASPCPTLVVS
jgi:nucleotide-binding universal stress UspA family protein